MITVKTVGNCGPLLECLGETVRTYLARRSLDSRTPADLRPSVLYLVDLHESSARDLLSIIRTPGAAMLPNGGDCSVVAALLTSEEFIHDWNADPRLKAKQFFIQAAQSYGIARVVSFRELRDFLEAILAGLVPGVRVDRHTGKSEAHAELLAALQAAQDCANAMAGKYFEKNPGPDERDVRKTLETPPRVVDEGAVNPAADDDPSFVQALAAAYHVGRYRRAEFYARIAIPWLGWTTSSRKFAECFERTLLDQPPSPKLREISLRRRSYHLLRDLGRVVATGRSKWPGRRSTDANGTLVPTRVLLLDDHLKADSQRTVEALEILRKSFWQDVAFFVATAETWASFSEWLQAEWFNPHGHAALPTVIPARELHGANYSEVIDLEIDKLGAILVDIQIEGRDRGPEIVSWLQSMYQAARTPEDRRPPIIILTSARASENIQLCLNLGVATYVFKDRLISLPASIPQQPLPMRREAPSAFASINLLPPRVRSALKEDTITGHPRAYKERAWLSRLPKTDLHYHIGTSIQPTTIAAMAYNTAGYSYTALPNARARETDAPESMQRTMDKVCNLVWLATWINQHESHLTQLDCFWKAAYCLGDVRSEDGKEPPAPAKNLFERLFEPLVPTFRPVRPYEVTAALVGALTSGSFASKTRRPGRWKTLAMLDDMMTKEKKHTQGLRSLAVRFLKKAGEASQDWSNSETKHCVTTTFPPIADTAGPDSLDDRWSATYKKIAHRVELAWSAIDKSLAGARLRIAANPRVASRLSGVTRAQLVHGNEAATKEDEDAVRARLTVENFAKLVQAPDGPDLRSRTLQRYLLGADLLGADHLQYIENILLAAFDIVEQNVRDNVMYSEIRCATTGYTVAGLVPLSATDVLCHSFDLASSYFAHRYRHRWVRVNVLLGAKRHKDEQNVRDVVALLESYRQRYSVPARDSATPNHCPEWWRPCRVIGFDLSGDEATTKRFDLEAVLKPLFESCAAITIHAGEAASAQSIWEAVYKQRARRIGHGLRLREHRRLMEYCVTEGICLELCPISNTLTNSFETPLAGEDCCESEGSRHRYPLPSFLSAGVPVCLNTDNRFLHGRSTLTDEYLCAAQMSGGLSKLEVLEIVKSGFKHAFLPKNEQREMLREIDDLIFRLLKEEDEEINGPEGA
jgi:adenosine deaminase